MALGILIGSLINLLLGDVSWVKNWLTEGVFYVGGKIFVSCLKLLVVPLVLVSLISGTAALDDVRKVGTVGLQTILLYLLTTAVAISLALGSAIMFKPGKGIDKDAFLENKEVSIEAWEASVAKLGDEVSELKEKVNEIAHKSGLPPLDATDTNEEANQAGSALKLNSAPPFSEVLINIFPSNPFASMAKGNMLQVIVFAILFGLALTMSGEPGKRVLSIVQDLNEIVMKLVLLLMELAPYGVFCLVGRTFATQGFSAIAPLSKYFFLVILVLIFHAIITYPLFLKLLSGLNPVSFIRKMGSAQIFAFSTSSSNATIPVTLETNTHKLGVSPSVASFTVPLGATINMDGTAIMQGVATVFIAQAWGIDLSLLDLLTVIATATLASIGTAGVPGVGLIMLSMVLIQVGLPVEGIAIIMGVDRLLDMLRTSVNITGDSMVTCVVAKWQKVIDRTVFDAKE